jgi:hypothetical protein
MDVLRQTENVTEFVIQSSHDSANSAISQAINQLKRETENWLYSRDYASGVRVAIDIARRLERVLIANRMAGGKFSRNTVAAMETFQRGMERAVAPKFVRDAMHAANDVLLVAAQNAMHGNSPLQGATTIPLVKTEVAATESVGINERSPGLSGAPGIDAFSSTAAVRFQPTPKQEGSLTVNWPWLLLIGGALILALGVVIRAV